MGTTIEPSVTASRYRSLRWRPAGYWLATVVTVAEQGARGIWDIARIPSVRHVVAHLGHPSYLLVLLGSWQAPGAATPRQEW